MASSKKLATDCRGIPGSKKKDYLGRENSGKQEEGLSRWRNPGGGRWGIFFIQRKCSGVGHSFFKDNCPGPGIDFQRKFPWAGVFSQRNISWAGDFPKKISWAGTDFQRKFPGPGHFRDISFKKNFKLVHEMFNKSPISKKINIPNALLLKQEVYSFHGFGKLPK